MERAGARPTKPRRRRIALVVALVIVALTASSCAVVWTPAIAPVTPPGRTTFSDTDIQRGATLAALGDCSVCHTARNGLPYAGGRGIETPFGTIYATNITPDAETGIGAWSLAAFRRAMRAGIDRGGSNLYPVLPYPHFTRATDADIAAMYAFIMTREPTKQTTPPNKVPFPVNFRPTIAMWNLLFLRPGRWQPDPAHDATWNQGSYLVEAVGHCGACHTPHNVLGAEKDSKTLAGGEAEGWSAPALQGDSPAPRPWTVEGLETYLRSGADPDHGVAAGPMTEVTHKLSVVPDADLHAIAVYIASLMPASRPTIETSSVVRASTDPGTESVFDGACGACHGADAPRIRAGAPSIEVSTAVNAPTPRNVVDVILHGLPWREGHAGAFMPGFASALTDNQVAALATFVRARYSERPPWHDIETTVREARREGGAS